MAGTRLFTQASFVLGVLLVAPFALWLLLPVSQHPLPAEEALSSLRRELEGLQPDLGLGVLLVLTTAKQREAYAGGGWVDGVRLWDGDVGAAGQVQARPAERARAIARGVLEQGGATDRTYALVVLEGPEVGQHAQSALYPMV
jgi:hypothetical protein